MNDDQRLLRLSECDMYFWEIWAEFSERVFISAARLTRHFHDAQDLASDCMARAYDKLSDAPAGTNILAWLRRTLKNIYFDKLRHLSVRAKHSGYLETEKRGFPLRLIVLARREIDALSEPLRSVAIDRHIVGRSYEEISARRDRSEVYIRRLVHLAKKQLAPRIRNGRR